MQFVETNTNDSVIKACLNAAAQDSVFYQYDSVFGQYSDAVDFMFTGLVETRDRTAAQQVIENAMALDTKTQQANVIARVAQKAAQDKNVDDAAASVIATQIQRMLGQIEDTSAKMQMQAQRKAGKNEDDVKRKIVLKRRAIFNQLQSRTQVGDMDADRGQFDNVPQEAIEQLQLLRMTDIVDKRLARSPRDVQAQADKLAAETLQFLLQSSDVIAAVQSEQTKSITALSNPYLCCIVKFVLSMSGVFQQFSRGGNIASSLNSQVSRFQALANSATSELAKRRDEIAKLESELQQIATGIEQLEKSLLTPMQDVVNNTNRIIAQVSEISSVFLADLKVPSLLGVIVQLQTLLTLRVLQFASVFQFQELEDRLEKLVEAEQKRLGRGSEFFSIVEQLLGFYNPADVHKQQAIVDANILSTRILQDTIVNRLFNFIDDVVKTALKRMNLSINTFVSTLQRELKSDSSARLVASAVSIAQEYSLLILDPEIALSIDPDAVQQLAMLFSKMLSSRTKLQEQQKQVHAERGNKLFIAASEVAKLQLAGISSEEQYIERIVSLFTNPLDAVQQFFVPLVASDGDIFAKIRLFSAVMRDVLTIDMAIRVQKLGSSTNSSLVLSKTISDQYKALEMKIATIRVDYSPLMQFVKDSKFASVIASLGSRSVSAREIAQRFIAAYSAFANNQQQAKATMPRMQFACGYLSLTPIEWLYVFSSLKLLLFELLKALVRVLGIRVVDLFDTLTFEIIMSLIPLFKELRYAKVDLVSWLKPVKELVSQLRALLKQLASNDPLQLQQFIESCFVRNECQISNVDVQLGKPDIDAVLKTLQLEFGGLAQQVVGNSTKGSYIGNLSLALYRFLNAVMLLINPWTLIKWLVFTTEATAKNKQQNTKSQAQSNKR